MADHCIVCSRSVPGGAREFCCPGCAAVYTIVGKMGLDGSARDERIAQLLEGVFPGGDEIDRSDTTMIEHGQDLCFLVGGMVCPACSWLVHHSLAKLQGVGNVNLNFIAETCTLTYDPMKIGKDDIAHKIRALGYQYHEGDATLRGGGYDYFRFGAGWFFALNNMMLSFVVYSAENWDVPVAMQVVCSILLAVFGTLVPLYAARNTIFSGLRQIIMRQFRMESLVFLSSAAAWIYSFHSMLRGDFAHLYFDVVALLLMLIETGNLISGSFYKKLSRRVSSLAWHLPKKARTDKVSDEYAAVEDLRPGQEFWVMRGELVPTDGILMATAEFDFSLITGESHGVSLEQGHYVGAGAKLLTDSVLLSVPAGGQSNLIKKIVDSTIEAFNTRKTQLSLGDRISQVFVPFVVAVGAAVLVANLLWGDRSAAMIRLLSVLIVACPCAFGIAEPMVLTAAIEKVRGLGIQIFNGAVLSLQPSVVVFDKTGTLTRGAPEVHEIVWRVDEQPDYLNLIASLENGIEHPIARALTGIGTPRTVTERTIARTVVSAKVDGRHYLVGSAELYPDVEIPKSLEHSTIAMFGDADDCYLIVGLRDTLRDESKVLVADLKACGMEPLIFSGDRTSVVRRVAAELGIADYRAEMGSGQKQEEIAALQRQGKTVMMVGDGINDAQALAAADVGLAVFSGQIPAKMSSDGVFMVPEIGKLSDLPFMQRKVRRKIRQNYGWAFLYNIVGMALAGVGWLSPKYCAVGMVFSNLVVIFNSMYGMNLPPSRSFPEGAVQQPCKKR